MKSLADTPVTTLKGVGAKVAEKLKKLGLVTLQDVIFHLPARYEDRTRIYPMVDLHAYLHVSIQGEIMSADIQYGKRRMLLVKVSDGSGSVTLRFFHFSAGQTKSLAIGNIIRAFGEVRTGKANFEMMHPEYKIVDDPENTSLEESLTPVYPTTEGVRQLTLRSLTEQALKQLDKGALLELLPNGLYEQQVSLTDALHIVHRPPPDTVIEDLIEGRHPAQKRLVIEELLAHHLSMLKVRSQSNSEPGIAVPIDEPLKQKFLASLPYQPTGAQARVVSEIEQDMQHAQPMMRLIQGDVGSGKTLVAAGQYPALYL